MNARQAWSQIRSKSFRSLRRPLPVGLIVNGSGRAVLGCALCGASHSFARTVWVQGYGTISVPEAAHALDFRARHNSIEHQLQWLASQPEAPVGLEGCLMADLP